MLIANFCFSDDSITKKQSVTTIEGGMYLGDSKADTFMKKMDSLKTKMDSLDRALKANCVGEAKSSYEKLSLLTNKIDIYNNIIAPILVAIIIGFFTWLFTKRKVKRKIKAAPKIYVNELDKLIRRGVAEGIENAIINARAIVSARNSLRKSLLAISSQLNSEIDRLANEIGEEGVRIPDPTMSKDEIKSIDRENAYNTILVLNRIWPAKKEQIEVEVRKLLAEMGISYESI